MDMKSSQREIIQLGTFSVNGQLFGINILRMREIQRPQELTRVPCSIPEVLGVLNLRGQVIPVISLRSAMGAPLRPYDQKTRIIIVKIRSIPLGLMVDSIGQVIKVREDAIEDPPAVAMTDEAAYVEGVIKDGDKIILVLSLDNVIKSETLKMISNAVHGKEQMALPTI